jgi:hypothetical protein
MTRAVLSGIEQSQPNSSPGTGIAFVMIDLDLTTMDMQTTFDGLSANSTGAQIHGRTPLPLSGSAISAVPMPEFPTGTTAGTHQATVDLTQAATYSSDSIASNGGTIDGALDTLITGLMAERMYFAIDTGAFPDGEIRGFLRPFPDSIPDGVIDSLDFNALATHYNELGTDWELGDYTLDGRTNALDFNVLATHYGETLMFPSARLAGIVPEPVGCWLVLGALMCARQRKSIGRRCKTCRICDIA